MLVLVAILSISSASQVTTTGLASENDVEVAEVWLDSRPSDEPLRGENVVRRPSGDMPDFSSNDFTKTWTLVIDGIKQDPGVCGYSLDFTEPVDKATPKVFSVTAVDLSTCQVEFTVGIPTKVELPKLSGMEFETSETGSGSESKSEARSEESGRLGYMSSNALLLQDVGDESDGNRIRYTVYGEWKDFVNLVVNQVLSAVNAKVANNDKLSKHHCRHERVWRGSTGWDNKSTGKWGEKECKEQNYSVKAITSARFKNDDFILCEQDGPDGHAWVYYDELSARASTATSNWSYHYNIVSTWTDGTTCANYLHWADFHTFPGVYGHLDPI